MDCLTNTPVFYNKGRGVYVITIIFLSMLLIGCASTQTVKQMVATRVDPRSVHDVSKLKEDMWICESEYPLRKDFALLRSISSPNGRGYSDRAYRAAVAARTAGLEIELENQFAIIVDCMIVRGYSFLE